MNADRLLDAFNRLGDEPDTVQQFRKLVVGLAMSGKLVTPDEAALAPSDLLKQIEAKKRALVQQGVLRKQNPLSAVSLEDLPKGFTNASSFVRLGEIARIEKGQTGIMKAEPGAYPLVVMAEERGTCDHFDFDGSAAIVPLVSSAGHGKASLQRLHYQEGKFALGSILAAIFPHAPELISARFLFEYLTSFKDELLVSQMIGTANVSLSIGKVSDVPVPLVPPLVQRKVDELMGLCDRLEKARAGREAVRDRLAAASLARLNAPDPETFQEDARFALDALPALITRSDQIKRLRQTILNLAVRGKLVPQDPNDEPAINFDRAIPDDLERPFEVPRTWHWARLHTLGKLKGGGTPSKARDDFWDGNIPWVSPKDMKIDYIAHAQMSITEAAIAGSAANLIDAGSVLFVVRGMILAHSFPVAISLAPLAINQDMKALVLKKPEMGEYVLRALKGIKPEMLKRVQRSSHGTCRLEGSDYSDFLIPIPPLTEQHRIVARVDALMALCDRLEASLTATAATRRRLLDALLAEALAPVNARDLEAAE